MSTLSPARLTVKALNSNHPGSEFGVVLLEDSDASMTPADGLALLAEDGWTVAANVPCDRPGILKFLVSRKK
jgi:hypothetical protein